MAKETETFRLELEQLMRRFPDKAVLSRTELMQYLGKKRAWLDSHGFTGTSFTLVKVATILSKL